MRLVYWPQKLCYVKLAKFLSLLNKMILEFAFLFVVGSFDLFVFLQASCTAQQLLEGLQKGEQEGIENQMG